MKWLGAGLLSLMVIGFATPAAAQDAPKAEISAGWQLLNVKAEGDEERENFPKGWYFDVAGNITPVIGIVGQVSGNYKTFEEDDFDLDIHTFMGGVRVGSQGPVRGFGQFLVGGARIGASDDIDSISETNMAIQVGGGVNVTGSSAVGLRVGIDWMKVLTKDDGDILGGADVDGIRFTVGVVFGIGSR
jgi:hypothetical protein